MADQLSGSPIVDVGAIRVDPKAVTDLMQALERVFRIGAYYPAGHALCEEAAEKFLRCTTKVIGKSHRLRWECGEDGLHVQGLELEDEIRGVRHFRELLDDLGINLVDIDGDATATELYDFVTKLLAYRIQVKGAREFQQIAIENMPESIRLRQREFTARPAAGSAADSGDEAMPANIDDLISRMAKSGLDPDQLAKCRKLLEAIPEDLEARQPAGGMLPLVTWSDVEKLLMRLVGLQTSGSDPWRDGAQGNIDALISVFEDLEKDGDAGKSREAIDMLVSLNQRKDASKPEAGDVSQAPPDKKRADCPEFPVAKLRGILAEYANRVERPLDLTLESRNEHLSIMMQMLRRDQSLPVQMRVQRKLRKVLSSPMLADEWNIVVAGITHLFDSTASERLTESIMMLTGIVRRSKHSSALALLRDAGKASSREQLVRLWPFLLNEILLTGRRIQPHVFGDACELAASLPDPEICAELPQLEGLEALRDKRLALDVFAPPPAVLFRVFALLLESKRSAIIGEHLLRGLRRTPQNWVGAAVLPLVDRFQPRYRRFLVELLRQPPDEEPSEELIECAGKIVSDNLPALSKDLRKEPWVPDAVRMAGRLPVAAPESLLTEIAQARRLLIRHKWPADARRAAIETLAALAEQSE